MARSLTRSISSARDSIGIRSSRRGTTVSDELTADREDQAGRRVDGARRNGSPNRNHKSLARSASTVQLPPASENEELAELFLRGGAERIAADPRLANALEAQATMEQHLGVAFQGDADRHDVRDPREPRDDLGRAAARP